MLSDPPTAQTGDDIVRSVSAQASSTQAIAAMTASSCQPMTASSDQPTTAASDLPPKYDDLDQPPTYVEVSDK